MRAGGPRLDSMDLVQYGLHYAVVCQKNDPDKLDRIKVRLPWLDRGDTDQTHHAQMMQTMGGDKFGFYCLPDVDDAVTVMFVQGDISQPVIMGGAWSKPDNSPEPNEDGKNNFRGYRSRSGHRLILDDSGKTKVAIVDKGCKLMIGMGQFEKEGAGPNACAVFTPPKAAKTGVSFASMEGTFEITCQKGTLKVTAEQNITINATTTVDMKAGQDMSLSGSSKTMLTSGSPSNYDASKINIG